MSSVGMMRPFVVAAFFSDGQAGYQLLAVQDGVDPVHAAGRAVSGYYTNGGKLPLVTTGILMPTRVTLETALRMLDAIETADKAEDAKVISLVSDVPQEPEPPPPDAAA